MTRPRKFVDEHSNREWIDCSSEQFRVYVFPDMEIEIKEPLKLFVSESGGHRVFDAAGISNYIPAGWRRLYWKAKPGQPHYIK